MSRTVPEWIGKTDDTDPPPRVKLRIVDRQGGQCVACGVRFGPKAKAEFDHVIALRDKGENREANLQAICQPCHKTKTASEAGPRAKADRLRAKHTGTWPKSKRPLKSRGFDSNRYLPREG